MVDELAARLVSGRAGPATGLEAAADLQAALEELKVAQEELVAARAVAEEQQARYQDLFEFAPDGYLLTNRHGRIAEANRAAALMFHRSTPQLAGTVVQIHVQREDRGLLRAELSRMRQQDRTELTVRLLPRKAGDMVVHVTIGAVRFENGALRALRWLVRDVTQQQRVERELRDSRQKVRAMAAKLALVEEQERRRIATDIHDNISQSLAVAKLRLGMLRESLAPDKLPALDEVRQILSDTLTQTRTLTFELSPTVLYELGLGAAIEWLIEQRSGYGVTFEFVNEAGGVRLRREVEITLFQAVRELLANVIKHAKASRALVRLHQESDEVIVQVEDNGIGFSITEQFGQPRRDSTLGLLSLRERLRHLRGSIQIDSTDGCGTRVRIAAPIEPRRRRRTPHKPEKQHAT